MSSQRGAQGKAAALVKGHWDISSHIPQNPIHVAQGRANAFRFRINSAGAAGVSPALDCDGKQRAIRNGLNVGGGVPDFMSIITSNSPPSGCAS
jgi:hypothetical protein